MSKAGGWIHLDDINWTTERVQNGVMVKLKGVPFKMQLFDLTAQAAQKVNDVRWQIEELHRGLKQLTGTEKCQCRKGRSQRNHKACCYHAWLSLKVKAKVLDKTLYKIKSDLLRDYLWAELATPRIHAFKPV